MFIASVQICVNNTGFLENCIDFYFIIDKKGKKQYLLVGVDMMTQSRLSLITVPHSFQAACEGSVFC